MDIAMEIQNSTIKNKTVYCFFKRLFDILSSFVLIVLLSPLYIVLAIIIKTTSSGHVFFVHKRVGLNGKEIGILKFRSMVENAGDMSKYFTKEQKEEFAKNFKLENDPRVTKIGNFLRKTSLDELPQLFNILKGDLSVVGPRPVTEKETQLYKDNRSLFLSVTPGLTGYWAANGRSEVDYDKRIEMELYYVKNRSVLFDIKIIFKTIISVLKREGAQ